VGEIGVFWEKMRDFEEEIYAALHISRSQIGLKAF